jgi:NAD(P)H-dependent FMN reductase
MNILAFAATAHRQSINKKLVQYTTSIVDADINLIDLNDFEMPIYTQDREQQTGIPQQAQHFFDLIGQADAIVISFAEHNGSYTAAYKNLYDWTSRIDMRVYQDKPSVLLATSPGPGGASNVLNTAVNSAKHFAMDLKGSFSLPRFFDHFDSEQGQVTNNEYAEQLATLMAHLTK